MRKLSLLAPLFFSSLLYAQAPDSSFSVKIEAPPAKKGEKSVAHIRITPGTGFHMNKEFPTSLTFAPLDGVTMAKSRLGIPDAAKWEEQGGAFDVAYTATEPGKKIVTGEIKFAVCSASSCDPKKSKVSFEINVK